MTGSMWADQPLLLRGGLVLDPEAETFRHEDLYLCGGRVARTPRRDAQTSYRTVDVTGLLVTPGLVDLHSHVFRGQDLGVDADEVGPRSGTTTFVDAGSAGGHLMDAFRLTSITPSAMRVRAFVNIASIGTTSILLAGELTNLSYCDEQVAISAAERHHDVIVGVKVRASGDVGGLNGPQALARARRVADHLGLPLMVHLGPAPATVEDILAQLHTGDVLTHCFTGFVGNQVVADGRARASVVAARDRGVILDVGHGMSGFDVRVAKAMVEDGLLPDTISSDLHTYSRPTVGTLADVLAKFLALGLTEAQVFARATLHPARAAGLLAGGVGTLRDGAPADVAVFRVVNAETEFRDGHGNAFGGSRRIEPVLTVAGGSVVFDRMGESG